MAYAEVIRVKGTVQGVGFRPFVWQLAEQLKITGDVNNDAEGVLIHAWAAKATLDNFAELIVSQHPPLAIVESIQRLPLQPQDQIQAAAPSNFKIIASKNGQTATGVVADAATCPACLQELFDKNNRRYGYPFTNCTHCGPRYSIIKSIPYDRGNTSMARFQQCPSCLQEYDDPSNRRFHAQPNACAECGPTLWLEDNAGIKQSELVNHHAIARAAELIKCGAIIAIKGIGGFHLAVDPSHTQAVDTLRERKHRYGKPLALMAKDEQQIAQYCELNQQQVDLLNNPAAPVVLLKLKPQTNLTLAEGVAPGQSHLGFMLPYSPLHHWLLHQLDGPIVLTSGNRSDEPQCIDNQDARQRLSTIADYFLMHDRDIVNRIDDSVVQISNQKPSLIRRARGYSPQPITLPEGFNSTTPIIAMGADLKNTVCFAHRGQAILSQHIGDLENPAAQLDFRNSIELLEKLFQIQPELVAIDKHPNYLSSRFGEQYATESNSPLFKVQHHHAHVAATMVDAGLPFATPAVFAVALDGLGFGDDGSFWGGEILLADYRSARRLARLKPVNMLGGNLAMREPWRNSLAQILSADLWPSLQTQFSELEFSQFLNTKPIANLQKMVQRNLNSPLSSSAGRLFDAVAAVLNICREQQFYEGQAAVQLQTLAERYHPTGNEQPLPYQLDDANSLLEINWQSFWPSLLNRLKVGDDRSKIAWLFHYTLSQAIVSALCTLARTHKAQKVALTGGVCHNSLLVRMLSQGLAKHNFTCHVASNVPSNDGAIALGQAAVALANCN